MDEIVYNTLSGYYNALDKLGYMPETETQKLLVFSFYKDFVFSDYKGLITKEHYHLIEKALDCLYGSTCLIPYPDYLKMGKLHIGEITELANRVKTLEETKVLKAFDAESPSESDIIIISEED